MAARHTPAAPPAGKAPAAKRKTGRIRVGIGGWDYAPWRKSFYPADLPKARALEYASSKLTSIEINGTFYRHQSPQTFAAWAAAVPDDFVFSIKAHRATTHGKLLADSEPAVERFLASGIAELGPKLGPILWQFPPYRKFDPETATAFLRMLPAEQNGLPLRHAIEARHPTFDDPAWTALLEHHKIAGVIVDSDKQTLRLGRTAPFCYLRLQRNTAGSPEGYDPAALDTWTTRIEGWAREGADCFVYFISGDKERAPDAALALLGRFSSKG